MLKVSGALFVCLGLLFWGCGLIMDGGDHAPHPKNGWTDMDTRETAVELARSLVTEPWLEQFQREHQRAPLVAIGSFDTETMDGETVAALSRAIGQALLDTGTLRLLMSKPDAVVELDAGLALEAGADYILTGVISARDQQLKGKRQRVFAVRAMLVDVASREPVRQVERIVRKP